MAVNNTIPIPVPPTMGGTGFTATTTGDTIYASATNVWSKLAKGTAGQIYQMNSGATLPAWSSDIAGIGLSLRQIFGCVGSGGNLYIGSTSHATKGRTGFDTTVSTNYFDEASKTWVFGDKITGIKLALTLHNIDEIATAGAIGDGSALYYDCADSAGTRVNLGSVEFDPRIVTASAVSGRIQFKLRDAGIIRTVYAVDENANTHVWSIGGSALLTLDTTLLTHASGVNLQMTGNTIYGNTSSGGNLALQSTSNATRGKITFGSAATTVFDEVNGRFGFGTASPNNIVEILGITPQLRVAFTGGSAYALFSVDTNGHITLSHTGSQIAIGNGAGASATSAIALGTSSHALGNYSIAIGHAADADTTASGIAIGYVADANTGGIAIGAGAGATGSGAVAIGPNVDAAANEFVCGGITASITNVFFAQGRTYTAPGAWTLNGTGGSGTDVAGGPLNVAGGKGTGAGAPGVINLQVATTGTTGTTLQTLATRFTVGEGYASCTGPIGVAGVTPATTPWTGSGWLRGLELPSTGLVRWPKSAGTYSMGIGYLTDKIYFLSATVDDATSSVTAQGYIEPGAWSTSAWLKSFALPSAGVVRWLANSGHSMGIGATGGRLYFLHSTADDTSAGCDFLGNWNAGGLFVGATTGVDAARALEVRSTAAAQARLSYDANNFGDFLVSSGGIFTLELTQASVAMTGQFSVRNDGTNANGVISSYDELAGSCISITLRNYGASAVGAAGDNSVTRVRFADNVGTPYTAGDIIWTQANTAASTTTTTTFSLQARRTGTMREFYSYNGTTTHTWNVGAASLAMSLTSTVFQLKGQTITGNNTSGGDILFQSTSNATKGVMYFGADLLNYYNEAAYAASGTLWHFNCRVAGNKNVLILRNQGASGLGAVNDQVSLLHGFSDSAGTAITGLTMVTTLADNTVGATRSSFSLRNINAGSARTFYSYDATTHTWSTGAAATAATLTASLLSLASGVGLTITSGTVTHTAGNHTITAGDFTVSAGSVGIGGAVTSGIRATIQYTSAGTNTAFTSVRGRLDTTMTTGSNFTQNQIGVNANCTIAGTDNMTAGGCYGSYNQVTISKTAGTLNAARAVQGITSNTNAGSITSGAAVVGSLTVSGSGNITTGIALWANQPTLSSTGVITTNYGVYISDMGDASLVATSYALRIIAQTNSSTKTWAIACDATQDSYLAGNLYLGAAAAPSARLHAIVATGGTGTTVADHLVRLESTTSGDDPVELTRQYRVTTTDATVTTLGTIPLTASKTYLIEINVVARRTGGAAGVAEDGAGYKVAATFKSVAGVTTLIGAVNQLVVQESQAGWDCTMDSDGATNVRIRVTGATNNNVTWHCTARTMEVGS